jgi:hypothetical protein
MLALVLTVGLFPVSSFAADLPFVDVSPEAWYYNDVKTAVDTGLVNGKSATTYCPDDLLTYAEAVKLAACMYQKNETGTVSLVNGDPWYQSYVDYAKMKGIIAKDYDWSAKATRAGYMAIFAHALPDASLAAKNEVPDGSIPDVPANYPEAREIYKLYRAGILQGSDDTYNGVWTRHLCRPADNIKRSEVAAILTRMMFVDKRISFSMAAETPADVLKITKQPADVSAKVGVSEKASFTVAVSGGKSPYTYQWYTKYTNTDTVTLKDNDLNSGTATAALTLTNIRAMDDGSLYWCVVTDAAGAKVTSSSAKLSILTDALKITKQPAAYQMKAADDTGAAFTVEISGGKAPYEYEWVIEMDGVPAYDYETDSNETKNTFSLKDAALFLAAAKQVKVYCEVSDSNDKEVASEKAELKAFVEGLKVTKQPQDYTMKSTADKPVFSVTVSGGKAPYTYTWYIDTDFYRGTGPSHTKNETSDQYVEDDPYSLASKGDYIWVWCKITDANGATVESAQANLYRYYDAGLQITAQPEDFTMKSTTDKPVFSVTVSGGKAPYTYAWYIDTDFYRGTGPSRTKNETSDQYVEDDPYSLASQGDYIWVWCKITDANGTTVESAQANLYRYYAAGAELKITKQPDSYWAVEGQNVTFTVEVDGGTKPYKYDWQWRDYKTDWNSYTEQGEYGSPTKQIKNVQDWHLYHNEQYQVRCVITDANNRKVITNAVTMDNK